MAYERPAWAAGTDIPHNMPSQKNVLIDVGEFIRTRDALSAAYLGLSASLDRAVKAYLDHTQVVLAGDAALNVSHLIQPFNVIPNHAQLAQLALGQSNGTVAPMLVANGGPVASEEPTDGKKKRKKRAYKARDPNAPKRPLTAYFRFLGENRGSIAAEIQANPELFAASGKPGDISRVATERWNALSQDEREPYRAAYQAALKEYEKEVEKYKAQGGQPEDLDETKVDDSLIEPSALVGAEPSEDEDSSEEEEEVAPPPPPPVKSPKKTAASKKAKPTTVAPSQIFSSIDPDNLVANPPPLPAAAVVAPASSPSRKRAAAAAEGEATSKKRSRKSGAAQEVVAAPDTAPVAPAVPVAPLAPSSPEVETTGKKKKDKKKRKSGDA